MFKALFGSRKRKTAIDPRSWERLNKWPLNDLNGWKDLNCVEAGRVLLRRYSIVRA